MTFVRRANVVAVTLGLALGVAATARAQQPCPCPAEPPPGNWVGSAGLGLSLNRGNTDTTNFNIAFDATYDPKKRDVWKLQGLYLLGSTDGETTVDRLFLQTRYERALNPRTFVFGQLQFLRDEFKEIDSLVAPSGGIGYKLLAEEAVTLTVDAGFGVKWEKNPGFDVKTSAVVTGGERLDWKLSPTATITQGWTALWDVDDFGDALYTFSAGLSTSIVKQLELKIELLDAYKTKPPTALVKKNDVALLTAVVYKF